MALAYVVRALVSTIGRLGNQGAVANAAGAAAEQHRAEALAGELASRLQQSAVRSTRAA